MGTDSDVKSYCNKCGGSRNHLVLHKEDFYWSEVYDAEHGISIDGSDTYELLRCRGCEFVSMRHSSWFSEDIDENGSPNVSVVQYPPATLRRKRDWGSSLKVHGNLRDMPEHISRPLDEIYIALQNNCLRLATMGIRSLLEQVMIEKVGDCGAFAKTLNTFHEQGFISNIQKDSVHSAIEAGHAVTHRDFTPSVADLTTLLDITENLIEILYVHPEHRNYLSKRIPPRK